ncbi:MAG: hypothetical protein J6Y02_20225 [Pseudobutyrivibrio sp.]|nr:hypothetical protein [Pseudobutyrivibrio sp.]
MLSKKFFEENCAYYNEPVVDKITGEIFEDMYTCYKNDHTFDHYKAIMDSNYTYCLLNADRLEYPFGNGTNPPHASIKDVQDHKADAFINIPTILFNEK